ncbi:MAG: peroxiredoxin [Candidatus Kariarchaeaceae archaeon]|jgi:peroxiredoxin Q/BCP
MKLGEGDLAPNFNFINQDGEKNSLHDVPGWKVVFFFPKAFTRGCTRESCSIQSNYKELSNLGITEVFGISLDTAKTQQSFAQKYDLEYKFISDTEAKISKSFGVFRNWILLKFADRDTFVIDNNNKIARILYNGVTGRKSAYGLQEHGGELVEEIKKLVNT